MAKAQNAFVCNECGADYPALAGPMQRLSYLEHHHQKCVVWRLRRVWRNERLSGYAGNAGVSKVQKAFRHQLEALPALLHRVLKSLTACLAAAWVPGSAIPDRR